jgi:hypothetical protein
MRRFLANMTNVEAPLAGALLGASLLNPLAAHETLSGSAEPVALEAEAPAPGCCSAKVAVYQPDPSSPFEVPSAAHLRTLAEPAEARAYLVETANPGYTMTRQGPELAIERLHPEFVVRLANAVREARESGLSFAGIFSAYRPPAFGIGGFSDKFKSLHTYGLAVDMHGIGRPGSAEARRWHDIAARHGVVCLYGPRSRAEWNHCQATSLRMVLAENPLRETVTAAGPLSLESMFEAGNSLIENLASAGDAFAQHLPAPLKTAPESVKAMSPSPAAMANGRGKRRSLLAARHVAAKCARRVGCNQSHRSRLAAGPN